ncbi:MAG: PAS domain S-box protein, partial [Thermodesulfobacteriota bacterium]|nr:PAS domain S-box protein [Thermodesulfobacteriota bacterium]
FRKIKEEYEKKMADKEVLHFRKIEIIDNEGNILPVELSAETTEYEGRKAFLFVLRDIAGQKRRVADLQKSEARYRSIIENIEDGYFELDISGNLTFSNESACRLLGYTREEMMGVNYRQYSDHEAIKRMYEAGNKTFRTGEPVKSFNWEVIGKDGTKRQVETSLSLIKGPDGESIGFRGIVRDITERKQAKEDLLRAQQEKIALIEQTTEAILSVGMDGKVETANPAAESLFGRSQSELQKVLIGSILASSPVIHVIHTSIDTSIHDRDFNQDFNEEKIRDLEAEVYQPDGTRIPVRLNAAVRKDDQGNTGGLIMAISDIREQKKMQRQLLDMAHQSGMAEIATGVLHNINNVLTSVGISSELLQESLEASRITGLEKAIGLIEQHPHDLGHFITDDPKGKLLPEYLRKVTAALAEERKDNLDRANKLIGYVEQVKKLVSTQQSYARTVGLMEKVDPGEILDDVIAMHAGAFQRYNIDVVRDYKDVPYITVDRQKLMQALLNLVKNAFEALLDVKDNRKFVLNLKIDTRHLGENRTLIISIRDNGVGIPEEKKDRIFEYGFSHKKHGSGFGLHTTGLAVKDIGGRISVQSDGLGKGAEFVVELPLAQSV